MGKAKISHTQNCKDKRALSGNLLYTIYAPKCIPREKKQSDQSRCDPLYGLALCLRRSIPNFK